MTDADHADELRRLLNVPWIRASRSRRMAAIERAIELLSRCEHCGGGGAHPGRVLVCVSLDGMSHMGDTIQSLIANVIQSLGFTNGDEHFIAAAILAQPEIASIIDLAASMEQMFALVQSRELTPEVRALLAAWRANRACTELTQEAQRLGLYDD